MPMIAAFKAGVARIINAQLAHPYARIWGDGTTSSSDGQFFPAAGRAGKRSDINTHYSSGPGGKFYTWVSDQHGHFHILPIGVTKNEAAYVLDGIYGHETRLDIAEHYVDTGGATDHVFALFALLGRRLAPRLRDLKNWCLTPSTARTLTRYCASTLAERSTSRRSATPGTKCCASASRSTAAR